MNRPRMEGTWEEMKNLLQERWGELSDEELDGTQGRRDRIAGLLQMHFGMPREEADRELDLYYEFEKE